MKPFLLCGALPLLFALTACPAPKPGQAEKTATMPALPDFRQPGYAVYRGLVAGRSDSLTLHLTITPASPGSSEMSVGGTYYGADGEPHEVQQLAAKAPAADSLLLAYDNPAVLDGDGNQQETRWCLRRQPDGHLTGTVGGQPAQWRPVRPALGFTVAAFADSVAALPGQPRSPYGHVSLQTLVPVGTSAAALAVGANIRRLQRGDTLPNQPVPVLSRLWAQQRAEFSKYYRADAEGPAPSPADSAEAEAYAASLCYESQSSASVVCQQGNLLSLSFLDASYSGGAHGNFASTVRTFDLRSGRGLTFDDIFLPAARTRLLPLLDRGVRRTLGIGDNEQLDTQLLDNKMSLTTNVCLVPGGVLFVYAPYEIAAYALGEITVFVPLAAVRPLLREGLPLPDSSPGLARR